MYLSRHKLCTRKMELALGVKFDLGFHWVTRPWWRTLTNGGDVRISAMSPRSSRAALYPSIYLRTPSINYASIRPNLFSLAIQLSIDPSIHPSHIHLPSIHLSTHPPIHSSVHQSVLPLNQPSINVPIHIFMVHAFFHKSIHLSLSSTTRSSINPKLGPPIHSYHPPIHVVLTVVLRPWIQLNASFQLLTTVCSLIDPYVHSVIYNHLSFLQPTIHAFIQFWNFYIRP